MITVSYTENAVSINGHADSKGANDQYDLVCAAVSAMETMWANGLTTMGISTLYSEVKDGSFIVAHDDCEGYQRVLIAALEQLAEQYPENIRIEDKRKWFKK